jgi:hypothetical protein
MENAAARTAAADAEDNRINEHAQALLLELPGEVRPQVLATKFPRIVNRIAELWRRPTVLDRYFDELLVDDRGGRSGFPLDVLFDITALKEHYQTKVYPRQLAQGTWDPRNRI